ncbi:GNAT family N-acetyltransferase [Lacinutrix undariae]
MIDIKVKEFNKLSIEELYDILQLRSQVFVVEQDCPYQDIDGKDAKALHVLGMKNGKIVAYTRIFNAGNYFENASIGRVVVSKNERKHKYGYDIMEASIAAVNIHFNTNTVQISAQCYLENFYKNLGFKVVGTSYLEDDIPHIEMIKH